MQSIADVVAQNVSMKAVAGHFCKPVHEPNDLTPPDAQPRDLRKLSKHNGSRDTIFEPTNLAERCQLQLLHILQLKRQTFRAEGPPNLRAT